jgi:hypothetical protein
MIDRIEERETDCLVITDGEAPYTCSRKSREYCLSGCVPICILVYKEKFIPFHTYLHSGCINLE